MIPVATSTFDHGLLAIGVALLIGALVSGYAKRSFLSLTAVFVVFASADHIVRAVSPGQQDPPNPPPQQQQEQEQTGGRGNRGGQNAPPAPRPYNQVITSAAKTDAGVFKVHRIGDNLFYEIPKSELNKDFLWVTQIKRTTIGVGYGGQAAGSRVVRWVQRGDRILLEHIDYSVVADPSEPIAQAVADANNPTIIRVFNVAAYAPSGDPVIDVTSNTNSTRSMVRTGVSRPVRTGNAARGATGATARSSPPNATSA